MTKYIARLTRLSLLIGFFASGCQQPSASLRVPTGPFTHSSEVQTDYDSANDRTNVGLKYMQAYGKPLKDGIDLSAAFTYAGKAPKTPETVILYFLSATEDWRFDGPLDVQILLDGNRLGIPQPVRKPESQGGFVTEIIALPLPYTTFLQLVNATRVDVRINDIGFKLSEDHLNALRDLASRTKS